MISLKEISELKGSRVHNWNTKNVEFSGISIDSRTIRKGELFFAIEGENTDGHNYLSKISGRIKAAVVDNNWYRKNGSSSGYKDLIFITVKDTTLALGEFAGNYRRKFLIPVIAVAGSNGKTTTRDMMAAVLSQKYKVLKSAGNHNNQYGVPLTLFDLRRDHEICVLETGMNHPGEIAYLCKISEPQYGLITNIAREHLEFLIDIKGVLKAESELFDYLKLNHGTFFLNNDEALLRKKAMSYERVISFGVNKDSQVKAKLIGFEGFYPVINIKYKDTQITFKSSMIGYPAFYSSICAAAVGFYFRINIEEIKKALSRFTVETHGRNELKRCGDFWLIDDTYNSNPDSVKAAFDNIKGFGMEKSSHIVLSDMLELGNASGKEHYDVGKLAGKYGFENLYTYGPSSVETYKGAKGVKNNFFFNDKDSLYELLKKMIRKNEVILVKGSRGMKMDQIIKKFTEDYKLYMD